MPNLSPFQLEIIADACDFYFSHLARIAAAAPAEEFAYFADAADACADIAEEARNAAETCGGARVEIADTGGRPAFTIISA